jgi:hypothetical protein
VFVVEMKDGKKVAENPDWITLDVQAYVQGEEVLQQRTITLSVAENTAQERTALLLFCKDGSAESFFAADGSLAACRTVDRLRAYEQNREAERHRAGFAREREILYQHLRKSPEAAVCFLQYHRFIRPDGVSIDFNAFRRADPRNPLIPVLASLQPVK